MKINSKNIGAILLIAGTSLGGGMLSLPILTQKLGLPISILLLIGSYLLATLSGLILLEVNMNMPIGTNIITMGEKTFGWTGKVFALVCYSLLMYTLLCAYISGATDIISNLIRTTFGFEIHNSAFISILFTTILGGILSLGMHIVEYFNRLLLTIKISTFIIFTLISVSLPVAQKTWTTNFEEVFSPIPIMITSFGYQIIIPSLRDYIGNQKKDLQSIIVIGGLIPLLVYLIWEYTVLVHIGPIENGNISSLIDSIMIANENHQIARIVFKVFIDIAVITSFIGVCISLKDMLREKLKPSNNISTENKALLYSLIPSLIIALAMKDLFLTALNYACIFVAVLLIVFPILMFIKLRTRHEKKYHKQDIQVAVNYY